MPKFSFEKIIKSDQTRVFDIITNFENLPKIIPSFFKFTNIKSSRDNVLVVEQHVQIGSEDFVMMTKHVLNKPNVHEMFVVGGDAKGTHITEHFTAVQEGTKMNVHVDFKLKGTSKISNLIRPKNYKQNFIAAYDEFAGFVES